MYCFVCTARNQEAKIAIQCEWTAKRDLYTIELSSEAALHVQGEVDMLTSFRDEMESRFPLGFVHALWVLDYGGIPPLIGLAFRPHRISRL